MPWLLVILCLLDLESGEGKREIDRHKMYCERWNQQLWMETLPMQLSYHVWLRCSTTKPPQVSVSMQIPCALLVNGKHFGTKFAQGCFMGIHSCAQHVCFINCWSQLRFYVENVFSIWFCLILESGNFVWQKESLFIAIRDLCSQRLLFCFELCHCR